MDSDSSASVQDKPIDIIFEKVIEESSEEAPRDEWSSLEIETVESNPKKLLYEEGLYDPGSGEICGAYIAQSASSVLRHPYYKYPAIEDPGILDALLQPEPPVIYPDDGQKLYLAICEEMNQCPVRSFYKGLLENEINLRFYGVNPKGVRAMAMALENNKIVKTFNLTDNFLNTDACYHLGVMLAKNYTLEELNLSGCKIGAEGFQMLLSQIMDNSTLQILNLRGNEIGDVGMDHLGEAIFRGCRVKMIDLSRNNISGRGIDTLSEAFETHNRFTHWDLSWNNLYTAGTYSFLSTLSETSDHLVKMDLSWNGLTGVRVAQGISNILRIPTLEHLNISNNKLEGQAIQSVLTHLGKAKKLVTFNLSYNPMTPKDAVRVLEKLKLRSVQVRFVYMDNVNVEPNFVSMLHATKQEKPYLVVTYGYVLNNFKVKGPDARHIVLNRAEYLCNKSKGPKVDFASVVLQIQKEYQGLSMFEKDFGAEVTKRYKAPLDEDLVNAIAHAFPGESKGKGLTINIDNLMEFVKRKWPDRSLPPTPPSAPVTKAPALKKKK